MNILQHYQRLAFSLMAILVMGLLLGHILKGGIERVGRKHRVLELADELAAVANRDQYLELLKRHYAPESPLWQTPPMTEIEQPATATASIARLPDGRLEVTAFITPAEGLLATGNLLYIPAALVDSQGRGYRLEDIRFEAKQSNIYFEYVYSPPATSTPRANEKFRFYLGRRQWEF